MRYLSKPERDVDWNGVTCHDVFEKREAMETAAREMRTLINDFLEHPDEDGLQELMSWIPNLQNADKDLTSICCDAGYLGDPWSLADPDQG